MMEDRKRELLELIKALLNNPGGQEALKAVFASPHHLNVFRFLTKPENKEITSIEEISKKTNIPESTTRRILKRFYKNGLVEYQIPKGGEIRGGPKPRFWRLRKSD